MKNISLIFVLCSFLAACTNSPQPVQNSNTVVTTNARSERPETAIAHGPQEKAPPTASGETSKWTQSGDPIDTTKLDAAIMAAEKALAAKPSDPKAKQALADAFLARATELTGARQYASALGDYRRTLKHDPENAEATQWIEQIINIYTSINRSYPKEGEEPKPLPFKKD